jgi:hypothetical protein
VIKPRSSPTVSRRHSNRKNSLAIYVADVFDEVRAPQNDADPARTIEPCLHRPAEWVDRNATLSILIFGNYGDNRSFMAGAQT